MTETPRKRSLVIMIDVTVAEVSEFVRESAIAAGLDALRVDTLISQAPPGWADAPLTECVADLVLVAPGISAGQVRVKVRAPAVGSVWELSVVATDRRGLLATTASVCASHGLQIRWARVASWENVALQRLAIEPTVIPLSGEPDWTALGQDLRQALTDPLAPAVPASALGGDFSIESVEDLGNALYKVTVTGADRVGLLAAITSSLTYSGSDIRSAELGNDDGRVRDVFVVAGISGPVAGVAN